VSSATPQITISLDLLQSLVDEGECWFDHHGGCQEHGFISLKHGEECPHAEAKRLIKQALEKAGG
jgi:hypothetical protein